MNRKVSILFLWTQVITSVLFFTACVDGDSDDDSSELPVVKTEELKIASVEQQVELTGNIEAFDKAYISPSSPMRISRIYKETGDVVRKGELLVQMDESGFRQSRRQLENLEKEHARLDTLYKVGSVSRQQLDQIETELDVARTAFENLKENTQLRSPISGVVTGRYFEDGEVYSASPTVDGRAAILSIMTLNPVKVEVNVAERFFPDVDDSLNVTLTLDSYPGRIFKGDVYLKYPVVDPVTRTFTVELKFPNEEKLIRPGMFGRVTLGFGDIDRIIISDLAVVRQHGTAERYAFVVQNGSVERRIVRLGRQVDDYFEVIDGLQAGEVVVTSGHGNLLDGMEVDVVE
ncbi:efflux RND transporter periplasmic adaptor subunit [Marinilabiliaceae bacterium ANBcel2]|nr:efflux RND transporter periplasmic adaptor subunit [Marinilabiliaceae bacterium ANBcel2]